MRINRAPTLLAVVRELHSVLSRSRRTTLSRATITTTSANAAIFEGLKTGQLLLNDATRANDLNYRRLPEAQGTLTDVDSNPTEIHHFAASSHPTT